MQQDEIQFKSFSSASSHVSSTEGSLGLMGLFLQNFCSLGKRGRRAKLKHNRLQSLLLLRSDKFDRSPTVPTSVWLVRDEKRQKCRQMKEKREKLIPTVVVPRNCEALF